MGKKKKKEKTGTKPELKNISRHDCRAEILSPSRGRFEERDSDQPDGITGNYS